jgi:citrate lyase beta subunit
MATMNGDDHRSEIVRLEEQIDELEATIESCRKFILAGRIAVASGGVILIAMMVGGIQFNSSVMGKWARRCSAARCRGLEPQHDERSSVSIDRT